MITKEIKAEVYLCEKCGKDYKQKAACETHEASCIIKSTVEEIFSHDGKYTYPTVYWDDIEFTRVCKLGHYPSDSYVRINLHKQHSIGENDEKLYSNVSNIGEGFTTDNFFDYCSEVAPGKYDGKPISIHENEVTIENKYLGQHDFYVTYEKGDRVKVDYRVPDRERGDGKIIIRKGDRIISVEIQDKEILKKELVKSTHKLDVVMSKNMMYFPNRKTLYEFGDGYSVSEDVAREFLAKTKIDLKEHYGAVIPLEGRRISHNIDDWLDIETLKVEHFQGSRSSKARRGLKSYSGETRDEALLNRAFHKADERVTHSPKGRFEVDGQKIIMPVRHYDRYNDLKFIDEASGAEVPFKDMLKILRKAKGKISVEYHE